MAAQTTAEAICSGACAAALAVLGVDAGWLSLAVLGCGVGIIITPTLPRLQAIAAFVASAPFGALVGHAVAVRWGGGDGELARIAAFVVSAFAVPLLSTARAAIEGKGADMWSALIERVSSAVRPKQ